MCPETFVSHFVEQLMLFGKATLLNNLRLKHVNSFMSLNLLFNKTDLAYKTLFTLINGAGNGAGGGVNFEGGRRFISNWLGLFVNQSDFYILSIQKTTKAIPVLHINRNAAHIQ